MRSERIPVALGGAALLAVALGACSPDRPAEEFFSPAAVDVLVVDAVLIVGEPLPGLRLSRTRSPDAPYTLENSSEQGAVVTIIDGGGNSWDYVNLAEPPRGLYLPDRRTPPVRPGSEYRLRVETARGEVVTARTVTPEAFAVERWLTIDPAGGQVVGELRTFDELGDGVYDAPENQLPYASLIVDARVGAAATGGFQLALFSLDLDSDFVIDPPFFDEDDFLELERTGSSPALVADNGGIKLPWFAIYFEGRHKLKIFAVDGNWFDLLRSRTDTGGGFGFGGTFGEGFEAPLFRVEGGIGLFGSASVDSIGFRVLPAP